MHPFITQLSAIVALLVLLKQLWSTASIGHTLAVSTMTGLAAYGVLLAGQLVLRYVLVQSGPTPDPTAPPAPAEGDAAAAPTPSATS